VDRGPEPAAGKRLRLPVLLAAAIFAAFPAHAQNENWRRDKLCGERLPPMANASVEGCLRSFCADTPLGKLCACVKDEQTDFRLQQTAWKVQRIPAMGGDADHFRLDRIGDRRLFVAMMTSESVGIAVSDWSVWAIDGGKVSKPIEVQNYGTLSFATKQAAGASCLLLAARWHSGWEPGRGHGMYIAGSWYAVEGGAFERLEGRPTIYRRYLAGIERARYEAEERNVPLQWFRAAAPAIGPRPVTGKP